MRYDVQVFWKGELLEWLCGMEISPFMWRGLRIRRELGFEVVVVPVD